MYLNEATLLNNVRLRYKKDNIYVSPVSRPLQQLVTSRRACSDVSVSRALVASQSINCADTGVVAL